MEFLDKGRSGMASTFLTRLRVGGKLVDAKGVSRLYRSRISTCSSLLLLVAGRAGRPGRSRSPSRPAGQVVSATVLRDRVGRLRLLAATGSSVVIDFRYHLVSIVAVFLALAVGIVLGAGPLNESISDSRCRRQAETCAADRTSCAAGHRRPATQVSD